MLHMERRILLIGVLITMFGVGACSTVFRGNPDIPQDVVDAIAGESVDYFEKGAPENSLLMETAKLELFWGQVLPEDEENYSETICFRSEIQFIYQGIQNKMYYQGVIRKPKGPGIPWKIDPVTQDGWYEVYKCEGGYMVLREPGDE